MGHLIVIELAKVLHIHFALFRIGHSGKSVELRPRGFGVLHGADHVAELAYAGRFNQNAIRGKLFQYLVQRLGKIPHQAAADAPGVHLGDIDTGFLQKAAVNANFAKFIFNEYQLLPGISFFNEFFNQCGFSSSKKTGKNINLRHTFLSPILLLTGRLYRPKIACTLKENYTPVLQKIQCPGAKPASVKKPSPF